MSRRRGGHNRQSEQLPHGVRDASIQPSTLAPPKKPQQSVETPTTCEIQNILVGMRSEFGVSARSILSPDLALRALTDFEQKGAIWTGYSREVLKRLALYRTDLERVTGHTPSPTPEQPVEEPRAEIVELQRSPQELERKETTPSSPLSPKTLRQEQVVDQKSANEEALQAELAELTPQCDIPEFQEGKRRTFSPETMRIGLRILEIRRALGLTQKDWLKSHRLAECIPRSWKMALKRHDRKMREEAIPLENSGAQNAPTKLSEEEIIEMAELEREHRELKRKFKMPPPDADGKRRLSLQMKRIGLALVATRKKLGLSAKEFLKEHNLPDSTLSNWRKVCRNNTHTGSTSVPKPPNTVSPLPPGTDPSTLRKADDNPSQSIHTERISTQKPKEVYPYVDPLIVYGKSSAPTVERRIPSKDRITTADIHEFEREAEDDLCRRDRIQISKQYLLLCEQGNGEAHAFLREQEIGLPELFQWVRLYHSGVDLSRIPERTSSCNMPADDAFLLEWQLIEREIETEGLMAESEAQKEEMMKQKHEENLRKMIRRSEERMTPLEHSEERIADISDILFDPFSSKRMWEQELEEGMHTKKKAEYRRRLQLLAQLTNLPEKEQREMRAIESSLRKTKSSNCARWNTLYIKRLGMKDPKDKDDYDRLATEIQKIRTAPEVHRRESSEEKEERIAQQATEMQIISDITAKLFGPKPEKMTPTNE